MRKIGLWSGALITGVLLTALTFAAGGEKPKYTIEEIMKNAHSGKNKLYMKLQQGTANDEEKSKLIDYYEELGKNKPPKGEAGDWEKRTSALLTAAKAAANGGAAERAAYKKAVNCTACHNAHKASED